MKDNAKIKAGDILIKIPRAVGKSGGDITGGLPRVTELFEARNPSNPAIVSEIDGEVSFGKIKRGNREIIITSKQGDVKRYLVPLSRQIIVQENDYVKAGSPLSDGAITPSDILNILGPTKVQEYICLLYTSDMVLGLYYITKPRKGVKGEGRAFYGPEAVSYTHLRIEKQLITIKN